MSSAEQGAEEDVIVDEITDEEVESLLHRRARLGLELTRTNPRVGSCSIENAYTLRFTRFEAFMRESEFPGRVSPRKTPGGGCHGVRSGRSARRVLAWLVSAASLAGCGGTTVSGSNGGTGGDGNFDAGSEEAKRRACAHYFTSQFSSSCRGATLPDTELSRLAPLFERSCVDQFAMPGAGYTADDLEACAAATEAAECGSPDGPPLACELRGSLAGNAPCISGNQCESGQCDGTMSAPNPGGPTPEATVCGKCAPVALLGEPCGDTAACPKNSICMTTMTSAPDPVYRCTAVAEGAVGSTCDDVTALCEPGAYCDEFHECAPLGALGGHCNSRLPNGCNQPFVCDDVSSTCRMPGTAGAQCGRLGDRGCAPGFGCAWSGQNGVCEPLEWVKPGEACDDARRCLIGSCGSAVRVGAPDGPVSGFCPVLVPDGQGCHPAHDETCDSTSECVNPTGTPGAPAGICKPISSVVCR